MDQTLVQNLLFALITAIVGVLAWGLRQLITIGLVYLQKKIGNTDYDLLIKNATTIVRFLAQSPATELWNGEQKKQFAINKLIEFGDAMKIDMSGEEADQLIEAAVQIMKSEFGQVDFNLDGALGYDLPVGASGVG